MTCGIYRLNFKGTDRCYIGQSLDIEKRFKVHLTSLRKGRSSKKLLSAYNTYGLPTLSILSECNIEELDQFENEAIEVFDSANNGFNCRYQAGNRVTHCGETAPGAKYLNTKILEVFHLLLDLSLDYKFISEVTETTEAVVSQIANGLSHTWISVVYQEEYITLLSYRNKRNTGELNSFSKYSNKQIISIMLYCLEHPSVPLIKVSENLNIEYSTVKSVVGGFNHRWLEEEYPSEYASMLKLKTNRRSTSNSAVNQGIKYPDLESPEGLTYTVTNIKAFCREHYLNDGHLGAVLKGKELQHKGWKLVQTVNE